jgi:hypothetical protein
MLDVVMEVNQVEELNSLMEDVGATHNRLCKCYEIKSNVYMGSNFLVASTQ